MAGRRIVFVADDLGCSAGANAGIARAAAAGLVREASVLVNGEAVAAGIQLARGCGLGLGLHLCLTQGRALLGPIDGLTDPRGNFLGLGRALLACARRRVDLDGAAREVQAQLQVLAEHGIEPTHLDGHHHVHCLPGVRDVVGAVAARAGIRWVRLPAEHRAGGGRWRPAGWLLRRLAAAAAPVLARAGLRSLPFIGIALAGSVDHRRRFVATIDRLPAGDYEWMVHPRVPDAAFARQDPRGGRRDGAAAAELATLSDPEVMALLRQAGVRASCYTDLD